MYRCKSILSVFALSFLLLGCASHSPQPVSSGLYAGQLHQQQLERLQHWSFKGRLAVKQPGDSWSASLRWQQALERYDIRLSGAFGLGAARLFGHEGHAAIESKGQTALTATSVELLMQEQLGWSVPVEGLRYWLLGSPGPGLVPHQEIDGLGRLVELEQAGWQVRYQSYMNVNGIALPRKLELQNEQLRARLVIDSWLFDENGV